MTTPAQPGLSLALSTDKESYDVGDQLVLTVGVSDVTAAPATLTISVHGSDSAGNTADQEITVSVNPAGTPEGGTAPQGVTVTVSDSFGDSYTQTGGDGVTEFVFTATIGAPPA